MLPLEGKLHTYSIENGALTAFESGAVSSSSCLLYIAGLTEGYMGTPYIHTLSSELQRINWSLCQLHMRSSYMGYGTGSLKRDFDDIAACITYLGQNGKRQIVLMGHSTGSQNSIYYTLNRCALHDVVKGPPVAGVILQAPVSDREIAKAKLGEKRYEEYVQHTQKMIQGGNANEIVPKSYWKWFGGGACTAYRFNSLIAPGGDDDFFSSDLSIERLKEIWQDPNWMDTPVLVLYGDEDQYVPSFVDKQKMVHQWRDIHRSAVPESVASRSLFTLLPHANHELSDPRAQKEMCRLVIEFLQNIEKIHSRDDAGKL